MDRLLAEHVSFRCTSVDRVGIRRFIRGLQYDGGVVKFLVSRGQSPDPVADPVAGGVEASRDRLVAEFDALVASSGIAVPRFSKGEYKERGVSCIHGRGSREEHEIGRTRDVFGPTSPTRSAAPISIVSVSLSVRLEMTRL